MQSRTATATTRFPAALVGLTAASVRVPLPARVSAAYHQPQIHMSASKRPSDVIELSSGDEEEPPAPKRQATPALATPALATPALATPALATRLRGVPVPAGWGVHAGSLLVWRHMSPQPASRIAAFDFDGCLARTPLGGNDPNAWSMQFPHVPAVLAKLAAGGHSLVVVTNESMDRFKKPEAVAKAIAKKCGRLEGFAKAAGVPLLVLCATAKDEFRKPGVGCWSYLTGTAQAGHKVDVASSFFVGDAAGRAGCAPSALHPGTWDRRRLSPDLPLCLPRGLGIETRHHSDHSDSDKVFAAAIGLPFFDEKAFFCERHPP